MVKIAICGWPARGSNRPITKTLLVMKLTIILLTVAIINVSAKGLSQTVSFNGTNVSLREVLSAVKKQTGFLTVYKSGLLDKANPVSLNAVQMRLEDFLDQVFKNQSLDFYIKENTIFISEKTAESIEDKKVDAIQPLSIVRGRVLSNDGAPLVGASVTLKGSRGSTSTDANGIFSFSVSVGDVLIISFVGYQSTEYKITSAVMAFSVQQSNTNAVNIAFTISLAPAIESMNEVVVNKGYYTEKQRLSTGNVSTVTSKDIEKQPVSNPLLALQGRMPGVVISQSTGVPGSAISIQIRGKNSIANRNDPLYIIDGVPYTSQLLPNLGSSILQQANSDYSIGAGNPLSFINPLDIENISILKDADATSIYGSRGANGVVLITTKKGNIGKSGVELNISKGVGKVAKRLDMLNTEQYIAMRREAFKNDGVTPTSFNAPDLFVWDTTKYTDWQKQLIGGTANYTNAQAAVSGGNSNVQYLLRGNYYKETTVFPGDFDDQKGSAHFNLNSSSTNQRFRTTFSGTYLIDNNHIPILDLSSAINTAPNTPDIYNSDGSLNWANSTWPSGNPLAYTKMNYKVRTNNLVSNLKLSYQIIKGLEISGSAGYTNMQVNEVSTTPIVSINPAYGVKTGSASFTNNNIRSWIVEPQINYNVAIGKGKLDALLGATFQQNISEGQITDVSGYTSDALLENIQAGPTRSIRPVVYALYKYNASFARLNYNWKDKYIINLNGRRDGSSRFGENNKFHNFGGIGLAWIFGQEDIVQKALPFLSFGKLRGSYGTTGNDQIGDYRYYDLFSATQYPYQNTVGFTAAGLNNPDLQWEETKKMEISADLGFFKDRILLNGSYYFNKSSNQLVAADLPATTGFSNISSNFPAIVHNTGWEFSLNTINIKSKNFTWSSNFNITLPKNKIASFPGIENSFYRFFYTVGEPLTITKVYHSVGVNNSTGAYQFINNQGALTNAPNFTTDGIAAINTAPKYYGGLGSTFNYKGFQLDFLFQFTKQMGKNYLFQPYTPPGFFGTNTTQDALSRWQKTGDESSLAQFTQSYISPSFQTYRYATTSDIAYTDASFIRLKNLYVSYNLQTGLSKKLHLQNCKVYIQAQNVFTITKYKGTDPETQSIYALPPLRVITGGVNIIF